MCYVVCYNRVRDQARADMDRFQNSWQECQQDLRTFSRAQQAVAAGLAKNLPDVLKDIEERLQEVEATAEEMEFAARENEVRLEWRGGKGGGGMDYDIIFYSSHFMNMSLLSKGGIHPHAAIPKL